MTCILSVVWAMTSVLAKWWCSALYHFAKQKDWTKHNNKKKTTHKQFIFKPFTGIISWELKLTRTNEGNFPLPACHTISLTYLYIHISKQHAFQPYVRMMREDEQRLFHGEHDPLADGLMILGSHRIAFLPFDVFFPIFNLPSFFRRAVGQYRCRNISRRWKRCVTRNFIK